MTWDDISKFREQLIQPRDELGANEPPLSTMNGWQPVTDSTELAVSTTPKMNVQAAQKSHFFRLLVITACLFLHELLTKACMYVCNHRKKGRKVPGAYKPF